ncbi:MAG: zinc ribbon domain-containing protein, partial [Caldimonas sp.]
QARACRSQEVSRSGAVAFSAPSLRALQEQLGGEQSLAFALAPVCALAAVEIAVLIVLALLMLICKIPYLGALLFVVVFPLSVVVAGVTITGLFICMLLSLPAIWQGAGAVRALSQTFAIVRSRPVETVLLLVFVWFLGFAVAFIVFGVLGAGLMPTLGMSMGIVGFGGFGMESMMAMSQGFGDGHAIAGAIGGALLWALAASLVGQVYLLGLSLVYLRVTEGLDLTASEEALRATFDGARRRTAELAEKARHAAQRDSAPSGAAGAAAATAGTAATAATAVPPYAPPPTAAAPDNTYAALSVPDEPTIAATSPMQQIDPATGTDISLPFGASTPPTAAPSFGAPPAWAPPPTPNAALATAKAPPVAPPPAVTTCPQCLSPVTPDDAFCGVCGYRLK